MKFNGVLEDAIRLWLFPFSLRDKTKSWLMTQPYKSITTWEDLQKKFLDKFFPPSKSAKLRSEINFFYQQDGKTLYEAWERFKDLLRQCPHHSFPEWLQIQKFHNGMTHFTRVMIDAVTEGSLNSKTPNQARELIETMAGNQHSSTHDQNSNIKGVLELDTINVILAQN